jgi:hypothetical protein
MASSFCGPINNCSLTSSHKYLMNWKLKLLDRICYYQLLHEGRTQTYRNPSEVRLTS